MGLLGNRQQPAASPGPDWNRDLAAELVVAQTALGRGPAAPVGALCGCAVGEGATCSHRRAVAAGKSLVSTVRTPSAAPLPPCESDAEFCRLKIEAGVKRLHDATMIERASPGQDPRRPSSCRVASARRRHQRRHGAGKSGLTSSWRRETRESRRSKAVSRQAEDLRSDDDRSVVPGRGSASS